MVKRLVEQSFDDLEYAEPSKAMVPAEHTVTLIVREGGGETAVELDLSEQNHETLWKELKRYFDAGSPLEPKKIIKRKSSSESIFRNRRMRKWADDNGFAYSKNDDSTYNYPKRLRDAFTEYEKAHTPDAPEEPGGGLIGN